MRIAAALVLVLTAAACGGIEPSGSASEPSASAKAQTSADHAYELARFLNSEERADQLWGSLLEAVPALLAKSPESAELMREQPDLIEQVMADAWPKVTSQLKGDLPALWEEIAAVYRRRLTPDEAERLLAYYSSPANVKLTRDIVRRIDLARAIDSKSQQVDRGAARATIGQAYPLALATLSPAEREQVFKFKASPLAMKYATLVSDLATARASWAEKVEPKVIAAMEREFELAAAKRNLN